MVEPKIGLEIHQQLSTGKLFCSCPSELEEDFTGTVRRHLRATTGEGGKVDRSAREEAKKERDFIYQITPSTSCLVELDEEPPHEMNMEALKTTLMFAAMVGAEPVDEIHTMRKIVIDGSNTGGFQRTSAIAFGGHIEWNGRTVRVESICLEEDAARKIGEEGKTVTYRLDRLGIPLIEIATAPDMKSGREAMEIAARIGSLLRSTRKVKRGLGTIREDVNISIPDGARVEIKGVQELRLIEDYVNNEVKRQLHLIHIREELKKREGKEPEEQDIRDITDLMAGSDSKIIKSTIKKKGRVLALSLKGFAGLLGGEKGIRLGSELAGYVRPYGVKGLFHSDELPAYGITEEEVARIREEMKLGEEDAFVLIAEKEDKARKAMAAVIKRAKQAFDGVPEETRDPLPDGTTRYSRPLSGGARMYPETDVPPITITEEMMEEIGAKLPELPEEIEERFVREYRLSPQQARQLVSDGNEVEFEELAEETGLPGIVARIYLNYLSEIRREGQKAGKDSPFINGSMGPDEIKKIISSLLGELSDGKFSKEAVPDLLKTMLLSSKGVDEAIEELGLSSASIEEIDGVIYSIVKEREEFVREKGAGAVGPLMGVVMKELRGRADGKTISERLKNAVEEMLKQ